MNVVVDTNVWVSAFLSRRSPPGRLLDMATSDRFRVVTTDHLWGELERVVHEPRIHRVLEAHGTLGSVNALLAMRPGVELVETETPTDHWLPSDPDDDWVIQCALTASAEYIVTGDKALLALGHVEDVKLVSPAAFLTDILKSG